MIKIVKEYFDSNDGDKDKSDNQNPSSNEWHRNKIGLQNSADPRIWRTSSKCKEERSPKHKNQSTRRKKKENGTDNAESSKPGSINIRIN